MTVEVKLPIAVKFKVLEFTNLAPVVATTPFKLDVISNAFVEVEIFRLLLFTIDDVETEPPIFEVSVLVLEVSELGTVIEATFKLVILATPILEVEAFTVSEFVVELLVVEAFSVAKFAEFPKITVKYADKPEIVLVTRDPTLAKSARI